LTQLASFYSPIPMFDHLLESSR